MVKQAKSDLEHDKTMAIAGKDEDVRELGRLFNRGEAEEKIVERIAVITKKRADRYEACAKIHSRIKHLESLVS